VGGKFGAMAYLMGTDPNVSQILRYIHSNASTNPEEVWTVLKYVQEIAKFLALSRFVCHKVFCLKVVKFILVGFFFLQRL
jgi:hypothetical protein